LLIGPWEHCLDAPVVDDLLPFEQAHVRRAAQRDVWTDELAWFEHHLQGQPQRSAVAEIFVTGAWRWLEWPDWPPPDSAIVPWYLGADGGVSAKVPTRGQRQFEFDPGCPNTIAAARRFPIEPFPYNTVPDERDDVLVYRSTPLDSGMLLAGDVVVELRASSTARDCDWVARLVDEYPDGRAICIRDGVLRSRFRNGFARPRLLTPGKRAAFHIELWQVAHWFRPGHRLRVEIASSALGRWDVNPQNGGDLARSSTLVVAQHTVYSGRGGTRILLPICAGAEQSCAL
jgi:putative CocE/NonD family hydrolase